MENNGTKYILSVNKMLSGIAIHTPAQIYDTEREAIAIMNAKIDYEVNNALGLANGKQWTDKMAKEANIEVSVEDNEAHVKYLNNPSADYTYYYIDEVTM